MAKYMSIFIVIAFTAYVEGNKALNKINLLTILIS